MKVFYHNDMDGRCAASIVAFAHEEYKMRKENFIEVDYRADEEFFMKALHEFDADQDNEVIIVDYSFTEKTAGILDRLIATGRKITWIDHHKSSLDLIEKYPEYNFSELTSPNKSDAYIRGFASGAALTFMYYFMGNNGRLSRHGRLTFDHIPYYIKLVSDYDCWKFEYPETKKFKMGIELDDFDALSPIWYSLFMESTVDSFMVNTVPVFRHDKMWINIRSCCEDSDISMNLPPVLKKLVERGNSAYMYFMNNAKYHREQYGYPSVIGPDKNPCFVMNRRDNSWMFGEMIKQYDCVLSWVFDGIMYVYSIYTEKDGFDCNEIAKHYGGGGHKGAAGFQLRTMPFTKIVKSDHINEKTVSWDEVKEHNTEE